MTAGLPGAGIGGMFYMLSAVAMPFHAVFRSIRARVSGSSDSSQVRWRPVLRQFAIAIGILAALWATGWLIALGISVYPESLGTMRPATAGHKVPNILRTGALVLSVGTLCFVLLAVQVARLFLKRPVRDFSRRAALVVAFILIAAPAALPQTGATALSPSAEAHLRAAEAAYDEGRIESAKADYAAVLAADPMNSRALYRMGQLTRDDRATSISMFRRYVAVVPADPWGHIALGDALASDRRFGEAFREYDAAAMLAPSERDVVVGRARVLASAGRTDNAIITLESWTRAHPEDAEALRSLGDQRRRAGRFREAATAYRMAQTRDPQPRIASRLDAVLASAAPAVEVSTSGAADSEENRGYRIGGLGSIGIAARARLGLGGGWKRLTGILSAEVADALLSIYARPMASLRFELTGGAMFTSSNDVLSSGSTASNTIAVGSARGVWKQPGGAGMLDLRATRMLLDASPELVLNRVVRNEIAGRADVPVIGRLRLRGGAKVANYDAIGEGNTRTSLLGGIAVAASDAAEISAVFQRIAYDHPTSSGYFAPRVAQLAEIGSYAEMESEGGSVLALDGGAGAQRIGEFGAATGTWKPAFRLFAQLTVPITPGSELRAEIDSYDSAFGNETVSSASWRYVSGLLSLRFALR